MKNDKNLRMLRRGFLAGTGAVGAAALLDPLKAQAESGPPQRLLILHRPCGTRPELWFPKSGGQKDWAMSALLRPFEGLRDDMVVLEGIAAPRIQEWKGDKHGAGMISIMCPPPSDVDRWPFIPGTAEKERVDNNGKAFTGTGPSVDQELLANVSALQGAPIGSLQLGSSLQSMKGSGPECLRTLSYKDVAQPLWPESRPNIAFDNIFGEVLSGVDEATRQRVAAQGKSVLDFVQGGLDGLKAQVPASQLPKLESHLQAIRSLESGTGPSRSCTQPSLADIPARAGLSEDDAKHKPASQQQLQLIKTAFECDLTRVVSFTFGYGNSDLHISQIEPDAGIVSTNGHHDLSHSSNFDAQAAYEAFYNQLTAKLLLDMKSIQESDGSTLLDNTLVVYFSECGIGDPHSIPNIPVLLFGGKKLHLNTGSYLKYTERRTFADLWLQTFRALGYDKPRHGDAMWNNGSLSGLYEAT